MYEDLPPGTGRVIDGVRRVDYYGYWIKEHEVPAETLLAKKQLIEAHTRRLFNHVEHGLNVPGRRLPEARAAYDAETDPRRRRVKAGMLAGALFNRAADIFTKLVEIQSLGVEIRPDNAIMRECGEHLQEALQLGKTVLHRSGEEGIDELWGEPFKAFAFPIGGFYKTRYIKIAQTMRAIDAITDDLHLTLNGLPSFAGIASLIQELAHTAKAKTETLRTDADLFEIWTSFVVCTERIAAYEPEVPSGSTDLDRSLAARGMQLIREGKDLVSYIVRARVPMPKTARELSERCAEYRAACAAAIPVARSVA